MRSGIASNCHDMLPTVLYADRNVEYSGSTLWNMHSSGCEGRVSCATSLAKCSNVQIPMWKLPSRVIPQLYSSCTTTVSPLSVPTTSELFPAYALFSSTVVTLVTFTNEICSWSCSPIRPFRCTSAIICGFCNRSFETQNWFFFAVVGLQILVAEF